MRLTSVCIFDVFHEGWELLLFKGTLLFGTIFLMTVTDIFQWFLGRRELFVTMPSSCDALAVSKNSVQFLSV